MKYLKLYEDIDFSQDEWDIEEEDPIKDMIYSEEFTKFLIDNDAYDKFKFEALGIIRDYNLMSGDEYKEYSDIEKINEYIKTYPAKSLIRRGVMDTIIRDKSDKFLYWINLNDKWLEKHQPIRGYL